jgi:ubiquitin-protein ligase
LNEPNPKSPARRDVYDLYMKDRAAYDAKVRLEAEKFPAN